MAIAVDRLLRGQLDPASGEAFRNQPDELISVQPGKKPPSV